MRDPNRNEAASTTPARKSVTAADQTMRAVSHGAIGPRTQSQSEDGPSSQPQTLLGKAQQSLAQKTGAAISGLATALEVSGGSLLSGMSGDSWQDGLPAAAAVGLGLAVRMAAVSHDLTDSVMLP
jgi:hypothetical protein